MQTVEVAPSGDVYTDALIEGPKWAGTALTYSFPTLASQFTGYAAGEEPSTAFEALNAQQQGSVHSALAQISSFTNLTFTEQTGTDASSAVLRFGMSDTPDTAWGYLPDSADQGGDVWFNNSSGDYDAPVLGNYAWDTVLHEIGHTLGLGHPHEADPPMPLDQDWMAYTVMSYRSYQGASVDPDGGYTNGDWGFAQTYMMDDIAALQFEYGANFNYRNTDTVYTWSPTTGEMSVNGVGQGAPGGNTIFMTIWDGGGNDTFDFSNHDGGATIDLHAGSFIGLAGQRPDLIAGSSGWADNIATARLFEGDPRSLIENAIGTSGDDNISGNEAANHLVGGLGNDTLNGWQGNDLLEGGEGWDYLYGGEGDDTLYGGGTAGDQMYGEAGSDKLFGGSGDDYLSGGDGDDTLQGGGGHDQYDGGAGNDTLVGGANYDSMFGGDGVDHLDGGAGDDYLGGDSGNDTLIGGSGNDTLDGGAGDDYMVGGVGDDYYWIDSPGDQVIEFEGEGSDTVIASFSYVLPHTIENGGLTESPAGSSLTGNELDNSLIGDGGENIIDGGAGADTMRGLGGNDTYYVDDSRDKIIEYTVPLEPNAGGIDTVYASVSYSLPTAADSGTVNYGVENLVLTGSSNIDGTGNDLDNTLQGNSGNNILYGMEGNDTLIGNDGNDILFSGTGNDTLEGGVGDDGMFFGAALDASDRADGGGGNDQVGLQGNYGSAGSPMHLGANTLSDIDSLVLLPGSDTRFGDTAGNHYSYYMATDDGNVAAGQQLTVNWNTLQVGENVTFDGSAETNGTFLTFAGKGSDHVTGGQQDDGFFFGFGNWGSGDSVDGQGGTMDQLGLQGNYVAGGSGAIVFGATQLSGIEAVVCLSAGDGRFGVPANSGYCYDLTMNDGSVAAGQTMYINANLLKAAGGTLATDETLTFNGSAETDGHFIVYSGAGADTITGGAGDDVIYGGGGADQLRGGGGSDTFGYVSATHSTSGVTDQILDFGSGDHIDLSAIDAIAGGGNDAFAFIGAAAFSHTAGELRVVQSGTWMVQGDTNGDGVADLVIAVTSDHALTTGDFVL